jgi:hypothetical protein
MPEQDSLYKDRMIGEFQDVITNVETGEVIVVPWQRNIIVNTIGNLIAARFFGNPGDTNDAPIGYWAIGSGNSSWDVTPGIATASDTILVNEFYRKAISPGDITYITPGDVPTSSNTNRLQIVLTFSTSEANGSWREFGIFGGSATIAPNSGLMINHKIHGRIDKTSAISITRTMRFTF